MNAKYKVIYYENLDRKEDEGIAFGKDMSDIVNNIAKYYNEDNIQAITIEFGENYYSYVIPREEMWFLEEK